MGRVAPAGGVAARWTEPGLREHERGHRPGSSVDLVGLDDRSDPLRDDDRLQMARGRHDLESLGHERRLARIDGSVDWFEARNASRPFDAECVRWPAGGNMERTPRKDALDAALALELDVAGEH